MTDDLLRDVMLAAVFSVLGIVLFGLGFWAFEKLTPGTLWREIIEEHNTALAILAGAVAIGLAIIISAAVT
jgi:uncharacterized membrane protein YjfL (UPF0719 family)